MAANLAAIAALVADRLPLAPSRIRGPLGRLHTSERLAQGSQAVQQLTRPWEELTGQTQYWGLFAPEVSDQVAFLGVELIWHDEQRYPRRWLPSPNEPDNLARFFRVGDFRLRRYESHLAITPPPHRQVFNPTRDGWPALVAQTAYVHYRTIGAYLRWRLLAFQRDHPDLPMPAAVILAVQLYHIPEPPGPERWHWEDWGRHPVARWRPTAGQPPGSDPLQIYNPASDQFK
jgi:hypothetical protein